MRRGLSIALTLLGSAVFEAGVRADDTLATDPPVATQATENAAGAATSDEADDSAADAAGFADPSDATGFAEAPGDPAGSSPAVGVDTTTATDLSRTTFHLSGSVGVLGAMRLEQGGVARFASLRLSFDPRLELRHDFGGALAFALVASGRAEADFAYLLRPEHYDAPTLEVYGSQLIPGEIYLRLAGAHAQLGFGEQIVNFGQGEVLGVLDVVNPRDLRVPLQADLAELRLPVLSTRVGLSFERFRADLVLVHEPWFGLLSPPLGEFSPFRQVLLDLPGLGPILAQHDVRYQHIPGRDPTQLEATQLHLQLGLRVARVDLTLQASSLLDGIGIPGLPPIRALLAPSVALPTYHPRYTLLGHSGVLSVGAFLLRWELGVELERAQIVERPGSALPDWSSERLNSLRGLLGLTYVPSARTSIGLELQQTGVIDNPARRAQSEQALLFPLEATQLALRVSHQFWRERMSFTLVALCIGLVDFNAFAGRAELSVAATDAVRIALGALVYLPSSAFGPFYGFERHDRLYANLRWSFGG